MPISDQPTGDLVAQALAIVSEIDLDDRKNAEIAVAMVRNLLTLALSTPVQTEAEVPHACEACGGRLHDETQECISCGAYHSNTACGTCGRFAIHVDGCAEACTDCHHRATFHDSDWGQEEGEGREPDSCDVEGCMCERFQIAPAAVENKRAIEASLQRSIDALETLREVK